MNLKYVKTEGNSEVYQYTDIEDYLELIEHYSFALDRLSKINLTEYRDNEMISDQDYDSLEMLYENLSFDKQLSKSKNIEVIIYNLPEVFTKDDIRKGRTIDAREGFRMLDEKYGFKTEYL